MSSTNETRKIADPTTAEAPTAPLPPLELSVAVPLAPEAAFRLFTVDMTTWWPLATHSVGQERARRVVVEPTVGGRVYEVDDDGSQHEWARVLAWEPASRFTMRWYPGRDAASGQEVELRFDAAGDGTRVVLLHRDWERLGERAAEARAGYSGGWKHVLGERFRDRATALAG